MTATAIEDLAELPAGPALSAALATLPLTRIPNDRMLEWLRAQARQANHEDARMAATLVELARCEGTVEPGAVARRAEEDEWATHESRAALHWTNSRAEREHALAEFVVGHLPDVFGAWYAGAIDRPRVQLFEQYLFGLDADQIALVCASSVPQAGDLTTGQLAALLKRLVIAIDPDAAARWYRRSVRERGVCAYLATDGTVTITAHGLPADQAQAACDRVERLAATARRAGHPGPIAGIRADVHLGLLDGRFHRLDVDQIVATLIADHQRAAPADADADAGTAAGARADSVALLNRAVARGPAGQGTDTEGSGAGKDTGGPDGDGPDGDGPDGDGPDEDGPDGDGPDEDGPDGDGPDEDGPDGDGPDEDGPDEDGPDRDGPDRDGPDQDRPDSDDPDTDDPGTAAAGTSSEPAGSGPADTEGPRQDGPEPTDDQAEDAHPTGSTGDARAGPVVTSSSGPAPSNPSDQRRGIEIRVSLSTLLGRDDHPGEIPGLGPVPAHVAVACALRQTSAEWRFAVTTASGTRLLSEGHTRRRPVGAMRAGAPPGGIVEIHLTEDLLTELVRDPSRSGAWVAVVADIREQHRDHLQHLADLDADPDAPLPTRGQRRHTEIRDRTCTFAGVCRRPAHHCDQDHRIDHRRGGPTVVANLGPVCPMDHAVKHRAGWSNDLDEDGALLWCSPLGGRYIARAEYLTLPMPDPSPGRHRGATGAGDPDGPDGAFPAVEERPLMRRSGRGRRTSRRRATTDAPPPF